MTAKQTRRQVADGINNTARQAHEVWFAVNQPTQAQMAELVDALGSGPNARKGVEVRVFFWAPVFLIHFYLLFFFDSFFWLPALATKQDFFFSLLLTAC